MSEKREMTPEIREKLKGMLPVSKTVGVPFTPAEFKQKELDKFAPVFFQRGFTEDERLSLASSQKEDGAGANEEVMFNLTRKSIVNMKNYLDLGTGEEISFKPDAEGGLDKDIFNEMPFNLKIELYWNAMLISGIYSMKKEEKEGLESSPQSTPG